MDNSWNPFATVDLSDISQWLLTLPSSSYPAFCCKCASFYDGYEAFTNHYCNAGEPLINDEDYNEQLQNSIDWQFERILQRECADLDEAEETDSSEVEIPARPQRFRLIAKTHQKKVAVPYRPLVCGKCGKRFKKKRLLTTHLVLHQKHQDGASHSCGLCGKDFDKPSQLIAHVRDHTKAKRHICRYCEGRFLDELVLKEHEKLHKNDDEEFDLYKSFFG